MLVLEVSFRSRTCPTRPAEPVDRIEPSATSQGAPRSDSTVWVCFSLRSSECFPATLVETRDPDQTTNELKKRVRKQKGHLSESQIILWFFFFFFTTNTANLRHFQRHPAHLHALQDHRSGLEHGQHRSPFLDLSGGEAGRLGLPLPLTVTCSQVFIF